MAGGNFDELIAKYLKATGHHDIATTWLHKLKADSGGGSGSARQKEEVVRTQQELQVLLSSRPRPRYASEEYPNAFAKLADWVDNSLEIFRYELSLILYPLLVHSYLKLLARGDEQRASALMDRFSSRFLEVGGLPCRQRAGEIAALREVTKSQQIPGSHVCSKILQSRHRVSMSATSKDLLMNFLAEAGLAPLLAIVNDHLALDSHRAEPLQLHDDRNYDRTLAPDLEDVGSNAGTVNRSAVTVGVLEGGYEHLLCKKLEEEGKRELKLKAEQQKQDGKAPKSKDKGSAAAAEARVVRDARTRAIQGTVEPPEGIKALMDCQDPDVTEAVVGMMRKRQAVGPDSLPSCLISTFFNTANSLNCCKCTPDATLIAAGFDDSSVRLYDVRAERPPLTEAARAAGEEDPGEGPRWQNMWCHSGPVYGVDFLPDASGRKFLLSASGDGTVRFWSEEIKGSLVTYLGHMLPVWDVAACPYGYYFATGGADRSARLYCTDRKHDVRLFAGHQADVGCVAWHPACHVVATGSADRTVRLWSVDSGSCVRVLTGFKSGIASLAFSGDGTQVAAGTLDGSIMVWDIRAARALGTIDAHRGAVWALAGSHGPGPGLWASGGADCTVRLWRDPGSGARLAGAGEDAAGRASWHVRKWRTRATHVYDLSYTYGNLLLAAGALQLPRESGHVS
ncbi:unnamed protein product [Pedinophyceae sp. YPF-701]|nr:unnamed protein product [Pedinophyceae sp. YPF-701]